MIARPGAPLRDSPRALLMAVVWRRRGGGQLLLHGFPHVAGNVLSGGCRGLSKLCFGFGGQCDTDCHSIDLRTTLPTPLYRQNPRLSPTLTGYPRLSRPF